MKTIFFWLFLLVSWVSMTQIVEIPDPILKARLVNYNQQGVIIDTNADGEIQVSEAEALTGLLQLSGWGFSDATGIEAFINITELRIGANNLTSIDVSSLAVLETLLVSDNLLESLDVSANTNLEFLLASENNLTSFSATPSLRILGVYENPLSTLDLENALGLRLLECNNTQLSVLELPNSSNLATIYAEESQITEVIIPPNNSIFTLDLGGNPLREIDLINATSLQNLGLWGTELSIVDVRNNLDLKRLRLFDIGFFDLKLNPDNVIESFMISDNDFEFFDFSKVPFVKDLQVHGTPMQFIDLSQNPNICRFLAYNNPNLERINLQNGNNTQIEDGGICQVLINGVPTAFPTRLDVTNSPNLAVMCVDDVSYAIENFEDVPTGMTFTEDCSLGVDSQVLQQIVLSPNPTSGIIHLSHTESAESAVLYSFTGQVLARYDKDALQTPIDISQTQAGVYLLQIQSLNQSQAFQIVKQ